LKSSILLSLGAPFPLVFPEKMLNETIKRSLQHLITLILLEKAILVPEVVWLILERKDYDGQIKARTPCKD